MEAAQKSVRLVVRYGIMDGQMNLAYFELLAEIIYPSGERVGYCFVELLPEARNPGKKIGFKRLFKRL